MAIGQEDAASDDALPPETMCELLRGLLAAAIHVDIEGEINGAWAVAQLSELVSVKMRTQRAGDVAKTGLPQHGIVKQSFNENHLGVLLNLLPGIQATLRAGEKSMSESGSGTAAVEVDDASVLAARKDDAPVESVTALRVEQAETPQEIARIALSGEMPAQAPTRGITDAQFFDQGEMVQSALFQIVQRLWVAIELLLIKSGGLFEYRSSVGWRNTVLLEVSEALAKRQMAG